MKKLLILSLIFVMILFLEACSKKEPAQTTTPLTSLSISDTSTSAIKNITTSDPLISTTTPVTTTLPPVTTLPEIDMEALYKKIFDEQSELIGTDMNKEYPDPDFENNEALFYYSKIINSSAQASSEFRIWKVKGITSDKCGTLKESKYRIQREIQHAIPVETDILDYYHTKYLEVLLENLTYTTASGLPSSQKDNKKLVKVLTIYDGSSTYIIYDDMSLYKKNDSGKNPIMKADQTVDLPYLYMMACANDCSRNYYNDYGASNIYINKKSGFDNVYAEIKSDSGKHFLLCKDKTIYQKLDDWIEICTNGMIEDGFFGYIADITVVRKDAYEHGFIDDLIENLIYPKELFPDRYKEENN